MTARVFLVLVLGMGFAADAHAQWSAPSFLPPRPGDDIGVYVSTMGNFGIQGIWRQHGNLNLGVRAGWIDADGDGGGVVVAAESWGLLLQAGQGIPIDLAWTLGAGAVFNDGTFLEVPLGASAGLTFAAGGVDLQIYAHPRVSLLVLTDVNGEDDTTFEGLLDLGADLITAGGLKLRLGATLGRFDAIGVGVAMRWGRGVEVR